MVPDALPSSMSNVLAGALCRWCTLCCGRSDSSDAWQGAVRWVYLRCTRGSRVGPEVEPEDVSLDSELAATPRKAVPKLDLAHGDSRDLLIPATLAGSSQHASAGMLDGGESARSQQSSMAFDARAARDAVSRANSWASTPRDLTGSARQPPHR